MSGGLFALLDDIAVLAKAAAASIDDVGAAAGRASAKAAGVIVDDTAVTPRYVEGLDPKRELPIIKKIAIGSLRNKLLFILPAALLLSQFLPEQQREVQAGRLSADPLALVRHRIGLRLAEYARACTHNQAGTRPGDAGTVRPVAQP
mgnify:CR=1 FL=1